VRTFRERQQRNFLATLLLSQGVPMLSGGDELGRTQRGNNNAYCQDGELTWFSWPATGTAVRLLDFTRRLIRLRLDHPVFRRRRFFQGRRIRGSAVKDLSWLQPDGAEMTDEEWNNGQSRCLGLQLAGDAIEEFDDEGLSIRDDTFLILLNADDLALPFVLPNHQPRIEWEVVLDTRDWDLVPAERLYKGGEPYPLEGHTLAVLRQRAKEPA
jgi:glycogen operon protein